MTVLFLALILILDDSFSLSAVFQQQLWVLEDTLTHQFISVVHFPVIRSPLHHFMESLLNLSNEQLTKQHAAVSNWKTGVDDLTRDHHRCSPQSWIWNMETTAVHEGVSPVEGVGYLWWSLVVLQFTLGLLSVGSRYSSASGGIWSSRARTVFFFRISCVSPVNWSVHMAKVTSVLWDEVGKRVDKIRVI